MGNLVIHGGSVQNTLPSAGERYNVATVMFKTSYYGDIILEKAIQLNKYSSDYVVYPNINISGKGSIFQSIRLFYVDIRYFDSNVMQYKNITSQMFDKARELVDILEPLLITVDEAHPLTLTFYLLKNNNEGLNISGTSFLYTQLTRQEGVGGKIGYNTTYRLYDNSTNASLELRALFNGESRNSLFQYGNNNLNEEQMNNIITNEGMTFLMQNQLIKIMKFNRFNKRKLSNFNVNFLNSYCVNLNTSNSAQVVTNNSKLLCTFLCSYNYSIDGLNIQVLGVSTPNKTVGYFNKKVNLYSDRGFFNVYIFATNLNMPIEEEPQKYRSIAIEFLSVDAVNIPASYEKQYTNNNNDFDYNTPSVLFKSKTKAITLENGRGADLKGNSLFCILSGVMDFKKYTLFDNKFDVIRIYSDRTCDVYSNALSIESVSHKLNPGSAKTWFFKLNK